jgi:outer membrane receptor protein involved in Fe transport
VHGNHLFKFGADLRFSQQNAFRDVESRGRLQFSPFARLPAMRSAICCLGFPLLTSVARVDNPQQIRTESYNFFINDSYRVTPRLTINGGLRYEYNSPPVDAEDRATF